jgi:hypothetical protein
MEAALERFQHHRKVFRGLWVNGNFSLPRQHALVHYVPSIKLFGSPNGICSSITESKPIRAVKQPYRRSSKFKPLGQILRTNTRLSKLTAATVSFKAAGMLVGTAVDSAHVEIGLEEDAEEEWEMRDDEEGEAMDEDGEAVESKVELAQRHGACSCIFILRYRSYNRSLVYTVSAPGLAAETNQPAIIELIRRFLFDQIHPNLSAEDFDLDACPPFHGSIKIYSSASATFYAPSELSGPGGMHREIIRSTPQWYGTYERRDTVLLQDNPDEDGMRGMVVGRVLRFMSIPHASVEYPCALVEWFERVGQNPDPLTGLWRVRPTRIGGRRAVRIVPLGSIFRACQLIGMYERTALPPQFHFSHTHIAFKFFYVNSFADYHAHETIF